MMSCTSATSALSCARGRYLTAGKQCVLASACPQNTFADSTKSACTKCFQTTAATCKDATSTGATSCMSGSCYSDNKCQYANRLVAGNYCPNNILTSCGENVQKCDATGKVTACKTGYTLTGLNECIKCAEGEAYNADTKTCGVVCVDAMYNLGFDGRATVTRQAQYSSEPCTNCYDAGALQCGIDGQAKTCVPGWTRDSSGQCSRCKGNERFLDFAGYCQLLCPGADYMADYDGSSVALSQAKYWDKSTGYCTACNDPNAIKCDGSGATTACLPYYNLVDGVCTRCDADGKAKVYNRVDGTCADVPTCEAIGSLVNGVFTPGTRLDTSTNTCVPCGENAISCDASGTPTRCYNSFLYVTDGKCASLTSECDFPIYGSTSPEERARGFAGILTGTCA
ncbi:hypothetical protein JCM10449v2_002225 [Rhodotorula kratochvilovae]